MLLDKFKQFAKSMFKDYNKRKHEVVAPDDLDAFTVEVKELIDELAKVNIVYDDVKLHVNLVFSIDTINRIAKKAKLKDKEIKNLLNSIQFLKTWYQEKKPYFKQADFDNYPYMELYSNPMFAAACIEKYMDMLVSKTVDYIPDNINIKNIEPYIDLLDALKIELYGFIKDDLFKWVYPFTENTKYIGISLQCLNNVDNLGDKIEKWVEEQRDSKLQNYLKERGFEGFVGWGNLAVQPMSLKEEKTVLQATDKRNEAVVTKAVLNELINNVHSHMYMYIHNEAFNPRIISHMHNLVRTIACVFYSTLAGKMVKPGVIATTLKEARAMFTRSKIFKARKDRKHWEIVNFTDDVVDTLKEFIEHPELMQATLVATHALDTAIPISKEPNFKEYDATLKQLHAFLKRSYEYTFKTSEKLTEEQINRAMNHYQQSLAPIHASYTPENTRWVYQASLEFWLNIRDPGRVEILYKELEKWFTARHTVDINQRFLEENVPFVYFLSYHNKKILLDKLEKEPIEVVSYGRSKDIYDDFITLIKRDLEYAEQKQYFKDTTISVN